MKRNNTCVFPPSKKKIREEMNINELINEAIKAREHSYSPYSKFKVGAALRTRNGKIFTGCNIENSSYGLSICAEREAIFKAISSGEKDLDTIAVVTDSDILNTPCGACRQVMWEFSKDITIIAANLKGKKKEFKIKELLAYPFGRPK
ncbi:MAG: cytidine deaminase [Candidatus Scalinduaceae bacterium]